MIKIMRNCKRGEGRSQGIKGAQKHANSVACENFTTKIAPLRNEASSTKSFHSPRPPSAKLRSRCETGLPLRNHFAAQHHPLRNPFSGTRVPFHSPNPHFAAAKRLRNPPRVHFTAQTPSAKHTLGTRVPFRNPTLPFRSYEMSCKNAHWLQNEPPPTKISTVT